MQKLQKKLQQLALASTAVLGLVLGTSQAAHAVTVTINEGSSEAGSVTFFVLGAEFNDLSNLIVQGLCVGGSPCSTSDGGDTVTLSRAGPTFDFISVNWTSDAFDPPDFTGDTESFTVTPTAGNAVTFTFNSPPELPEPGSLTDLAAGTGLLALALGICRKRRAMENAAA